MENQRGIVPRKIKGFRDINPSLNQVKWKIINAASQVYKKYGFEHWDSPILEYADSLGKYLPDSDTIEKGVYSFRNPEVEPVLKSDGKELRDDLDKVVMDNHYLSLRYDLTAPLARNYAERLFTDSKKGNLTSKNAPLFRRYQYGPVYRYEVKIDPGRFREFWQLDFDTVGTLDIAADAEACMVLSDAMEAIGLRRKSYVVKVNNRKILKGLLNTLELSSEEPDILRVIDKADKISIDALGSELGKGRTDSSGAKIEGLNLAGHKVESILSFLREFQMPEKRATIIERLYEYLGDSEVGKEGVDELGKINKILNGLGYDEDRVVFEPTLVRGLAYYTGPVFEVESNQTYIDSKGVERKVGSLCGGGRYDGLVDNLLGVNVPATGASIGVDRLAELLLLTNQVESEKIGPVFVVIFDDELMPEYQKIASELRANDIDVELYYGLQRGLKKQFAYADKKNCPFAIMVGGNEIEKGVVTVKDLRLGRAQTDIQDKDEWRNKVQKEIPRDQLLQYIKNSL